MSEEVKGDGVTPEQSTGGQDQEMSHGASSTGDTVKYDTYKRTLAEAKKAKSQLSELQERLSVLEQEKLTAEGNKDELISKLQSQVDDYRSKYQRAHGEFAHGRAMDVIVDEASKMGVASTGLLRKAVSDKIADLEFDDEYRPNREQVKMILEDVRREEPFLFSSKGPGVAAHNPATSSVPDKKATSKLSEEELDAAWGNLGKRS